MGSTQSKSSGGAYSTDHANTSGVSSGASSSADASHNSSGPYPQPSGHEYDTIDKIAAELPNVIDEESKQQVEDYKQACDNGKGPMVACFATGEYLSLFERKHAQAADLYRNVCFRPQTDKSPNSVLVDGTKAYPAGCFNLAKMLMTGKGRTKLDRAEAYQCFDRACRGGHGGACYLQAQLLAARPGALGPGVPHDLAKAMRLYEHTCVDMGDSIACYTLATMLLRGDRVRLDADNVSPQEARGEAPVQVREHEVARAHRRHDDHYVIARDPVTAAALLQRACDTGAHVTSCHNLAVMYTHGEPGVPADAVKAAYYKKRTEEQMELFGGLPGL